MPIIKVEKDKNFTVINNIALRMPELSLKAKGMFAYLMTLPEDWKIYQSELVTHFKDGKDSVNSAIKELEKHRFIFRKEIREVGKFKGYDYTIYETPQIKQPKRENRNGKTAAEKPISENPQLLNTNNKLNTNRLNTKALTVVRVVEIPDSLNTPLFYKTWDIWLQYKKERKEKMSDTTISFQINKLSKTPNQAVEMINQSIENGWKGLFEIKGINITASPSNALHDQLNRLTKGTV